MFTVKFAPGVFMGYREATAQAATIQHAVDLVKKFSSDDCVIVSSWAEHDGQQVMEVYDWLACWSSEPAPPMAQILAPLDQPL